MRRERGGDVIGHARRQWRRYGRDAPAGSKRFGVIAPQDSFDRASAVMTVDRAAQRTKPITH
jgi:hypothetical protein